MRNKVYKRALKGEGEHTINISLLLPIKLVLLFESQKLSVPSYVSTPQEFNQVILV